MKVNKQLLALVGLLYSGGLITANALGFIKLNGDRDFFLGVFGTSAASLGLVKKQDNTPNG